MIENTDNRTGVPVSREVAGPTQGVAYTMNPWTAVAPLPPALNLSDAYDPHAPNAVAVRSELARLAETQAWKELSWPQLLDALIAAGRTDVALARLLEGHVDALRILAQAGTEPAPGALYGVWASRSERTGVRATPAGAQSILDGTIRFASGSGVIDRALVPVWLDSERHQLIELRLPEPAALDSLGEPATLTLDTGSWATSAMEVARSHTWTFSGHPIPTSGAIGAVNFYLSRPEFFPGGVGVAACWLGGAARVADLAVARLSQPLSAALQHRCGLVRAALAGGAAMLDAAGRRLADEEVEHGDGRQLATEARSVVAAAVHTVLDEVHRIAGPAGLAYDRALSRAVHDLRLYVLQSNADADAAYLGGLSAD